MKRTISFFLLISILMVWIAGCTPAVTAEPTPTPIPPTPTPSLQDVLGKLHWFGIAAFLYHGSQIIYFDPVTLDGNLPPADLILVTHGHHWSVADIKKVIGPNTTLIISPNVSSSNEALQNELGILVTVLAEGETTEVNGVKVEAVPAYDTSTTEHPRQAGGVGYIVSVDGLRIYHAGGTAAYPEMAQYTCDVALIPAYSKVQVQAIAEIVPAKVIIIMHTSYWGAQAFADLFTQDIGGGKTFVALETGPYNP